MQRIDRSGSMIRSTVRLEWIDLDITIDRGDADTKKFFIIDGEGQKIGEGSLAVRIVAAAASPTRGHSISDATGGPRWIRRPGDALRDLIYHATRGRVRHGIGCEMFRQDMNRTGWVGCLRRWRTILSRCRDQAAAENMPDPMWFGPFYLVIAIAHGLVSRFRSR